MSTPPKHTLHTTATGYKAMRGNQRKAFLGFAISQLRLRHPITELQSRALADIASISTTSESQEILALAAELVILLARESEHEPQHDNEADARESRAAQDDVAEIDFTGVPELGIRLFHAILQTHRGRPSFFFDEVPVTELGRVTMGQIIAAADELTAREIIVQESQRTALHMVKITPGLHAKIRSGVVRLPMPKMNCESTRTRTTRTPSTDTRSTVAPSMTYPVGTKLIGRNDTACLVLADGYDIAGQKFGSLTAAATYANGKRTSGPSFWRVLAQSDSAPVPSQGPQA